MIKGQYMISSRILIVDDSTLNLSNMRKILEAEEYKVFTSHGGNALLEYIPVIKPDLILMDIIMPTVDGVTLCQRIKAVEELRDIPIVMVTSRTDGSDIKEAYHAGAIDYIRKPVIKEEIISRISIILKNIHQNRELEKLAKRDSLTGLYNHKTTIEIATETLKKMRNLGKSFSILMLDIDYFKKVNDTYGHNIGDYVLLNVSQMIKTIIGPKYHVGRYGGEEFCVIISDLSDIDVMALCYQINHQIKATPFIYEQKKINITISIGACYCELLTGAHLIDIIKKADEMLYQAKDEGRDQAILARFKDN